MALLSKGSSLISGGIWRLTLARRRRTGRGGGGAVSALQQVCASQPLLAQASFVAGCGGVSAALQQGACAASSPGRGAQPRVAQASSFVGCDALQHVSAGGGSLLPSMLLRLASLCCSSSVCSQVSNHRSGRGTPCKRSYQHIIFILWPWAAKTHR